MMKMPHKFRALIILAAFLVSLIFSSAVSKETEAASFSVSYDITYTFNKDGSATVVQKTSLKNLKAKLYPSEYSISVSSPNVKSASGLDSSGAVKVSSSKKGGSTILTAKLNDKIIGKNKVTKFTLNYTIKDLSSKKGRMRSILVPGVSTSEKLDSFKLTVKTPKSYGKLYSIFPTQKKTSSDSKFNKYTYDKKKTPSENIVANFGDYQVVEFSFKSMIKNTSFFKRDEKIIIPPDTYFQEINFTQLNPRPEKMETVEDGNYHAFYSLKAGEEKEIIVEGYARIDKSLSKVLPILDSEDTLLSGSRFWEIDDLSISKKASELENIESIYEFVTTNFEFNSDKIDSGIGKRLGAKGALAVNDGMLTSEFVDLFISLARAKGIQARQVIGFAFGGEKELNPTIVNGDSNSRELHTWVEYFDKSQNNWVQVDPTWGSTRGVNYLKQFDANHFTLITRGLSSEDPKIPGVFSNGGNESFKVKLVDKKFNFEAEPKVEIFIDKAVSGFPSVGKVTITNDSGKSLRYAQLAVSTESLNLIGEEIHDLHTIMPFSRNTVNIKLRSGSIFASGEGVLRVVLSGKDQGVEKKFEQNKKIAVRPFFSFNTPQIVLLLLLLATLAGVLHPLYKKLRKMD